MSADHEKRAAEWLEVDLNGYISRHSSETVRELAALFDTIAAEADAAGYARGVKETILVYEEQSNAAFTAGAMKERSDIAAWMREAPLRGPAETVYATAIMNGDHVAPIPWTLFDDHVSGGEKGDKP